MQTTVPTTTAKTRDLTQIAVFAVILGICAWISVPTTVPFTMQTFGVFLALGVLGGRKGTLSICVYLLLGIVGIPVFSAGTSGLGVLLGPTGGYMIAWIFSGLIMWAAEKFTGRKTWTLALSMLLGLLACYALGTLWFMFVYSRETGPISLWTALTLCVIPFILPDLIKIALALTVRKRLRYFLNSQG